MKRYTKLSLAAFAGVLALGTSSPAVAGDVSFAFGVGFAVGGTSFQIAYASPHSGYAPYYYRTAVPLRYSGYQCSSHCFRGGGHWYHAPSCPLVGYHFSHHGFYGPPYFEYGYFPYPPAPRRYYGRYYGGYYGGHRSHHGYYGRERYGYGHGHHGRGGHGRHQGYYGRSHGGSKHGVHGGRGEHRGRRHGSARRTRPPRH